MSTHLAFVAALAMLVAASGCAGIVAARAQHAADQDACQSNDPAACLRAAKRYNAQDSNRSPSGTTFMLLPSGERAIMIDDYERACIGRLVEGCTAVAQLLRSSGEHAAKARVHAARGMGCMLGDVALCRGLLEASHDPTERLSLLGRICGLDEDACLRTISEGVGHHEPGTLDLVRGFCARAKPESCGAAGRMLVRPDRDTIEAVACDRDDPKSCDDLASLSNDPAIARTLYQRGCRLGYQPACEHLGKLLSPPR